MECMAYSSLKQSMAIFYKELPCHLDHRYRLLSHARTETRPEIFDHATEEGHPGVNLKSELTMLEKHQMELLTFDEKLSYNADRSIALDLDDVVKVNYGKFGDRLAEVKAVHGEKGEGA